MDYGESNSSYSLLLTDRLHTRSKDVVFFSFQMNLIA